MGLRMGKSVGAGICISMHLLLPSIRHRPLTSDTSSSMVTGPGEEGGPVGPMIP